MTQSVYSVHPLVLRAGKQCCVAIDGRFEHSRKILAESASMLFFGVYSDVDPSAGPEWLGADREIPFTKTEKGVTFTVTPPSEGEYSIFIYGKNADGSRGERLAVFSVYALDSDLFSLRPRKGDFHIHSFKSDGRESPSYVGASARKAGFDFMALTDHGRYAPSLEVIQKMKRLGTDMKCFPGEEVHLPGNPVHIINFGASESINAKASDAPELFKLEVEKYKKSIQEPCGENAAYQTAVSEWAFDRIREAGGISMFCHPYWEPEHHNYIGDETLELIMKRGCFDVLEVFGGFYRNQIKSNMLSLSRYMEERAKGKKIPVAGVSDAHGCDGDLFNWYYTIVFSESCEFSDLAKNIRAENCVAVHAIPGTYPIIAGQFRLTRFAYFLVENFYPVHDAACAAEGELLFAAIEDENDSSTIGRIAEKHGSLERLFGKLWADVD